MPRNKIKRDVRLTTLTLCTIEYGNGCLVSLPDSYDGRQDTRGGHFF